MIWVDYIIFKANFLILLSFLNQTYNNLDKWTTRSNTQISVPLSFLTIFIEQRKNEAERIRERYPDRIPVICEKSETSKLPDIDKNKYFSSELMAYWL